MLVPSVTVLGLRLTAEEVRIAVALRQGTTLCEQGSPGKLYVDKYLEWNL